MTVDWTLEKFLDKSQWASNETRQALLTELSAIRRDAARWRWVEANASCAGADFDDERWTVVMFRLQLKAADLGEAIDREIEKEQGDEACNR